MTTWGRFDPHFDSLDDFMSTALATCYLTVPQLFCWIQDQIHLQCDWVLFKVPLLPYFFKECIFELSFQGMLFSESCVFGDTIALMRGTLWNKQVKGRFDRRVTREWNCQALCPCQRAKVLSLSCFITGGSEEWKGEKGKNVSVI